MKNNPKERREDLLKVLFCFDAIFLIISIFYFSKFTTIAIASFNFVLIGSYFVLEKYGYIFEGLIATNKFSKGLNKKLGGL